MELSGLIGQYEENKDIKGWQKGRQEKENGKRGKEIQKVNEKMLNNSP